jgi:hypothetical protein
LSIFWTSSGSCPLCLTPPCYHLEPPATAALFYDFVVLSGIAARCGNYVESLAVKSAGLCARRERCWAPV